ncbi:MAG: hypothetical protein Q6363_002145 [Candidatus Njordarchaeota archaeon]
MTVRGNRILLESDRGAIVLDVDMIMQVKFGDYINILIKKGGTIDLIASSDIAENLVRVLTENNNDCRIRRAKTRRKIDKIGFAVICMILALASVPVLATLGAIAFNFYDIPPPHKTDQIGITELVDIKIPCEDLNISLVDYYVKRIYDYDLDNYSEILFGVEFRNESHYYTRYIYYDINDKVLLNFLKYDYVTYVDYFGTPGFIVSDEQMVDLGGRVLRVNFSDIKKFYNYYVALSDNTLYIFDDARNSIQKFGNVSRFCVFDYDLDYEYELEIIQKSHAVILNKNLSVEEEVQLPILEQFAVIKLVDIFSDGYVDFLIESTENSYEYYVMLHNGAMFEVYYGKFIDQDFDGEYELWSSDTSGYIYEFTVEGLQYTDFYCTADGSGDGRLDMLYLQHNEASNLYYIKIAIRTKYGNIYYDRELPREETKFFTKSLAGRCVGIKSLRSFDLENIWHLRITFTDVNMDGVTDIIAIPDTVENNSIILSAFLTKNLGYVSYEYKDFDGDHVPDDIERKLKLDPMRADTDNDGLIDSAELFFLLNPYVNDRFYDSNLNGVSNYNEAIMGNNPYSPANSAARYFVYMDSKQKSFESPLVIVLTLIAILAIAWKYALKIIVAQLMKLCVVIENE